MDGTKGGMENMEKLIRADGKLLQSSKKRASLNIGRR